MYHRCTIGAAPGNLWRWRSLLGHARYMYGYVRYRLGAILAEAWGRSASVDSCGVLVESWWSLGGVLMERGLVCVLLSSQARRSPSTGRTWGTTCPTRKVPGTASTWSRSRVRLTLTLTLTPTLTLTLTRQPVLHQPGLDRGPACTSGRPGQQGRALRGLRGLS